MTRLTGDGRCASVNPDWLKVMAQPLQQFEGKYEILAKIGEGGMGSVYKVRHRLLDEVRVIKVMRPQVEEQEQVKDRFLREARIAVKLRHPNIAQMYDFSVDDTGTAFIVMEYVDGITLQTVFKKSGPPAMGLVLEIIQQALQALAHLHKKGIVHRDISPDNLMLGRDDMGEPRVKLIDLGIAKTVKGEHNLTATGVFLGKIRYASPEQFRPQEGQPIDHRADLYSLGVVLYELLTGVHPIRGDSWSQLIAGHLFEPPLDFAQSDPGGKVPAQLRKVVLKALAKPVGDRFQDAKSFRSHIVSFQRRFPWADEDVAASLVGVVSPAVERPRAGSTQDRIIRQFGGGSTPPPLPTTPPPPTAIPVTPPPATPGGTPQLEALLAAAAHLVDLQMWSEARLQVASVLKLAPGSTRAEELRRRVEEGEARAREVARAVSEVERLIERGELDSARQHVGTALGRLAGATELEAVRERVERLNRERHEAALARLLEAAGAAADVGNFVEAIASLEQVLSLEPGHTGAARQLEAARIARAAQVEEERHARAVAQAVSDVEKLMAADRLEVARSRLEGALTELGRAESLVGLEARLAGLEQQRRRERVATALERGRGLLGDGDPLAALAAFEEALGFDDGHPEAARGVEDARRAIAEAERQAARERALASAVDEVERLLVGGQLEEAAERLGAHRKELGDEPPLTALAGRLERATAARDAAERVATLVREASAAADAGDPARAVERLEKAAELDPSNGTVKARLDEARQALAASRTPREPADDTRPLSRPDAAPAPAAVDHTLRIDVAAELAAMRPEPVAATGQEAPPPKPPPQAKGSASPSKKKAAKPKRELEAREEAPRAAPLQARSAPTPTPVAAPTARRRLPLPIIAAAAVVVVVVVGLVLLLSRGGEKQPPLPPASPGTLVIAATPWATVIAVKGADGVELPLPGEAVTPLRLEALPGRYVVTLQGPAGGEPATLEVEVRSGEVSRAAAGLSGLSADELLARYGL